MASTGQSDRAHLRELDRRHVWHPYTQMLDYARKDPVIVERAEGARLWDVDGRSYWDGVSSIWLNVHGHRAPAIDQAIVDQLGRVAHSTLLGQASVPSIRLAERLVEVAPTGLNHVFYSDNGSCANEAALKMALQRWAHEGCPERTKILSFQGGYHGDTLGAMGLAPVPTFHGAFAALLPQNPQVPYPYCYRSEGTHHPRRCVERHLEPVAAALEEHASQLAALFVEPLVQGVGGIVVMPDGFLTGLRQLCTKHDVLLVADEVATGFGRTGRMWACDHERVAPDILTCGKGLTGGYLPLAATMATDEIYDSFLGEYSERKQLFHGHSYTGNQLACAAALANLELLEMLLPQLPAKAQLLARELQPAADLPYVGDVRQKGLMVGLELVAEKATKTPFAWEDRAAWTVAEAARDLGLLVRPIGNVSILMPPLGSTFEEIAQMAGLLVRAHRECQPPLAAIARRTLRAEAPAAA